MDDEGFLGQFPMDILHTISKGAVPLLKDICDAYIQQGSKRVQTGSGAGATTKDKKKKKVKKKTKTQKRLGIGY